jgi:hypothetical protein
MSATRVIEIKGVKMEVDLRNAKQVETYKVGDYVKVLSKEYSNYESYPGVIIGFEPFQTLPTIIIAYARVRYSEADLKFLYFNAESKDVEIVKGFDDGDMAFDKENVMGWFDREVLKHEVAIADLNGKKEFFLRHFAKHVQPAVDGKKKKGWFKNDK